LASRRLAALVVSVLGLASNVGAAPDSVSDGVSQAPPNAPGSAGAAPSPPPEAPSPPPEAPSPPAAPAEGPTRGAIESVRANKEDTKEETARRRPRWHDSTLTLDQSVTTQTVGIGADYQSANSLYEWWVAVRPSYALYEDAHQSLSIKAWANLYYELTNSDTTTYANEPVIGPTFVWASYTRKLRDRDGFKTSFGVGPRFTLPTDKAARDTGQYLVAGAMGSLSQTLPLRRDGGTFFDELRLGFEVTYGHPITSATTPVNGGLQRTRQDLGGRTFLSDQLSPGTNVNHALNVYFSGDVRILPNLSWNVTYVLLNSWMYAPTDARVCTPTGCVTPQGIDDPTTFRPSTWTVTSLDFDPSPEVTLSLGYYNRATQLGPNGERRSALWSPDARFFLSVVAKLDAIYERLKPGEPRQVGQR
jgi:hypothetical protein